MTRKIEEGGTIEYDYVLIDRDDDPVPLAALTSLTMTLYDRDTRDIINSLEDVNVKNANNGTFELTSGEGTMLFEGDDNPIINDAKLTETHVALFKAAWSGGTKNWEFFIEVKNLIRVTVP